MRAVTARAAVCPSRVLLAGTMSAIALTRDRIRASSRAAPWWLQWAGWIEKLKLWTTHTRHGPSMARCNKYQEH